MVMKVMIGKALVEVWVAWFEEFPPNRTGLGWVKVQQARNSFAEGNKSAGSEIRSKSVSIQSDSHEKRIHLSKSPDFHFTVTSSTTNFAQEMLRLYNPAQLANCLLGLSHYNLLFETTNELPFPNASTAP